MLWTYPHFSIQEMKCKGVGCDCGGKGLPQRELMVTLEALRVAYNRPLTITSGYRCESYNDRVSTSGRTGPHTLGLAADIACVGGEAYEIIKLAMIFGFQGIGVSQRAGQPRFIHLDLLPPSIKFFRPSVWTY